MRCTSTRVLPEPGPASTSTLVSSLVADDALLDGVGQALDDGATSGRGRDSLSRPGSQRSRNVPSFTM